MSGTFTASFPQLVGPEGRGSESLSTRLREAALLSGGPEVLPEWQPVAQVSVCGREGPEEGLGCGGP